MVNVLDDLLAAIQVNNTRSVCDGDPQFGALILKLNSLHFNVCGLFD